MTAEQLPDDPIWFEEDTHTYKRQDGVVRPSVTQILKAGGVFSYDRIDPQVLERKRIIGSNVHRWTADFDRSGREADDVMSLYPEERGYAESYMRLIDSMAHQIEWVQIEKPMLSEVAGKELGGTPDRFVRINGVKLATWDLKTVAAFHPGWRLQLAFYNMMRSKRSTCAVYGRAAVRLMKDGRKAKLDVISPEYDHQDSAAAAAFITRHVWLHNHRLI